MTVTWASWRDTRTAHTHTQTNMDSTLARRARTHTYTHTAGCTLRLCSKMHAVLNTWRTTEFYFLIKLFTFTRNVLASRPAEVQSCLFSLTQENACGSCRRRSTALCSAAAYRPRSAPALPPVTAFVGQVSSKQLHSLCLCRCCCSSTCRRHN